MKFEFVTDAHTDDLVVFVLGMKVHRPWRVDQLGFATIAMFRMQAELERNLRDDASLGYLGGFNALAKQGPIVVQYWRSFEELERYARSDDHRHRPAWLKMYQLTHSARGVGYGLWHETYRVPAGEHEAIYGNMAGEGLGRAVGTVALSRRGRTSRERMNAQASMSA
ncbi:DUF4188 domain-containing protein [Tsukamurella sp. 8F]|uniref:DUF4188 domain-containing protein n=1 Tax=unclassified Tsukamurella TaxID=2633480 RepID=UPI0023B91B11|nr:MULTISPECIES: DUF4188 domain-containing protein [unclassified Tsukamurella]MDF0529667.1 DUF4188 domain-containing protein [Tsukamurella sp. 8J]MDF0585952.1 DUF4188 domain-containing protein [Tsukamurella sp. 8F]